MTESRLSISSVRWLFLLAVLACGSVQAGTVSVEADPNPVGQGESVVLNFEGKSVDGDPDFSPLKQDFDILGTSKRSSITIINGHFSKTTTWQINVMPKRNGNVTVPPIHFGSDVTQPYTLVVNNAPVATGKARDLFVEVKATPKSPYLQQQIIYKVRVYSAHDMEVTNWNLSDPKTKAGDAIFVPLGKDRLFEQNRNGHDYDVLERDFAVFPQHQGTVDFEPVVFEGQVVVAAASLYDPFSSDIRSRRVQSQALTLDVKAPPAAFTGKHWMPATGVQLHETWSDDINKMKAGEPITRTLSLLVQGQIASQLPDLPRDLPDGLKVYPDQPVLDDQKKYEGITGLRQEKLAIIASKGGDYTVPAVAIPWWNTEKDKLEIARLPAHTLHVAAAPGAATPPVTGTQAPAPGAADKPAATPPPVAAAPAPAKVTASAWPYWRWLSFALAAAWLLTILAWWLSRRARGGGAGNTARGRDGGAAALAAIRKAAAARDAAATREALLNWGRDRWPDYPPLHLSDIALREGSLAAPINDLQRGLYGRAAGSWSPEGLLAALSALPAGASSGKPPGREALQPLFNSRR
jgi:hypothetical protein